MQLTQKVDARLFYVSEFYETFIFKEKFIESSDNDVLLRSEFQRQAEPAPHPNQQEVLVSSPS